MSNIKGLLLQPTPLLDRETHRYILYVIYRSVVVTLAGVDVTIRGNSVKQNLHPFQIMQELYGRTKMKNVKTINDCYVCVCCSLLEFSS